MQRSHECVQGVRILLAEAGRRPWLAGLLARRGTEILARFVGAYRALCGLPRRVRRRWSARARRGLATSVVGAALLFALGRARPALAETITVDGVSCTLPDAIMAANTDTATNGCAAGAGADTIELETDVTLAAALPVVETAMTLNGNGHTIDGNDSVPVLAVSGAPFTLNDAVITGGNGQYSGGLYNSYGTVTINRSTIEGNLGSYTGGIFNFYGEMTINNSTISGNTTGSTGGGVANLDRLTLNNSTITGNSAYYGGGLYSAHTGTTTLNRSIISGNTAQTRGDEILGHAQGGVIVADNFNVFGYNGDARSLYFTPGGSDLVPTVSASGVLDPVLADHGGLTPVHALAGNSAAIDVAPDADCAAAPVGGVDQRGFGRGFDGDGTASAAECDAGAFEYGSGPTAVGLGWMRMRATGGGLPSAALGLGLSTLGYGLWRRVSRGGGGRLRADGSTAGEK